MMDSSGDTAKAERVPWAEVCEEIRFSVTMSVTMKLVSREDESRRWLSLYIYRVDTGVRCSLMVHNRLRVVTSQ